MSGKCLLFDLIGVPSNKCYKYTLVLAVINADKREVQVLDSLGEMFGHVDLNKIMGIS